MDIRDRHFASQIPIISTTAPADAGGAYLLPALPPSLTHLQVAKSEFVTAGIDVEADSIDYEGTLLSVIQNALSPESLDVSARRGSVVRVAERKRLHSYQPVKPNQISR